MPLTELKVVRCPGCNTAYNAASLPPGKGFRCKKCGTVVSGSAPTPEPAQTKRPSSRIDRKASGSTSRRTRPESRGERGEKSERLGSGRSRVGGTGRQKNPVLYVAGGGVLLAILGLVFAMVGGEEKKPAPRKVEEPVAEAPKPPKPPDDDINNWHLDGHETDFAKQRKRGSSGQDRSKIDPITGQGVTDDPPQPPQEEAPPKDPLDQEAENANKDP